ncbi:uncharacterized protein LOC143248129 [Tachypleus tridentatus]|uniref:uncharacterized protein LOC143248129 n=1 Tax=Tachypleus tridentatus TaxID=6853 RepID=UPI003FD17559
MFQNDVSALQMAHHEQFQRLAEDMRRHWEVEKSKLQKLHAEEIEAMKENFNRGLKHKKHIKEEIQHTMQQNQEEELKMLEKLFKQKVDNLQELLRNKELLELQAEKGKALSNDLHSSLEEEKLKNSELIKQLSKLHNMCFELEMTLSLMQRDLSDLKKGLVQCQKQIEKYLSQVNTYYAKYNQHANAMWICEACGYFKSINANASSRLCLPRSTLKKSSTKEVPVHFHSLCMLAL